MFAIRVTLELVVLEHHYSLLKLNIPCFELHLRAFFIQGIEMIDMSLNDPINYKP